MASNEYEIGELMGLRLIVAWLIRQCGQSTAFDRRFAGAPFDALLQEVDCGGNMPLSDGIRHTDLNYLDYHQALRAHSSGLRVGAEGTLKRAGQVWNLMNPRIAEVIENETEREEYL